MLFAAFRAYGPQRFIYSVMRRRFPIVVVGKVALVFRYDDVIEVLASDGRFPTKEVYEEKFNAFGGPYLLAMDRDGGHDSEAFVLHTALGTVPGASVKDEAAALHVVMNAADTARIRDIVSRAAASQVSATRSRGELNVPEFARRVTASLMAEYFGVPGPDPETLISWAHALFYGTFANLDNNSSVRAAALQANTEFSAYLVDLIARRKAEIEAASPVADDVLTRLLRLQGTDGPQLDDDGIRRNLQHLCDASDQVAVLATYALVTILRDAPAVGGVVRRAAETGNDAVLSAASLEATRFRPMSPFLERYCRYPTVLAGGTRRQKAIPGGSHVMLVTLSARFDARGFPDPDTFRFDRPPESYLQFGHGLHRCMGTPITMILLPELLRALTALKGLRAGSGIEFDGPVPHRFIVRFD